MKNKKYIMVIDNFENEIKIFILNSNDVKRYSYLKQIYPIGSFCFYELDKMPIVTNDKLTGDGECFFVFYINKNKGFLQSGKGVNEYFLKPGCSTHYFPYKVKQNIIDLSYEIVKEFEYDECLNIIIKLIQDHFEQKIEMNENTYLFNESHSEDSLMLDDLDTIEIIMDIENIFGIFIDETFPQNERTKISDITKYIMNLISKHNEGPRID